MRTLGDMANDEQGAFRYDPQAGGMVAVCSCGWRSSDDRSAGLLGEQLHRHIEDDHRTGSRDFEGQAAAPERC